MNNPFTPSETMESLFSQIDEGQEFADNIRWPYSEERLWDMALALITDSVVYPLDFCNWNIHPTAQKMYTIFKIHFYKAYHAGKWKSRN